MHKTIKSPPSFFTWMILGLLVFAPHIFLDYIYTDPEGKTYSFVNGQYYFYILTISSSFFLFQKRTIKYINSIFSDPFIISFVGLFLLGFCLSEIKLYNLRLLAIVGSLSFCMLVATSLVVEFDERDQNNAIILFTAPFFIPVFGALVLYVFGPLDLGIVFENSTHKEYNPHRWYLLNSSANGFGFDATITCITIYYFLRIQTSHIYILIMLLLFVTSVWVLLQSGTRASYIFFIAGVLMYELLVSNKRLIKIKIMVALICLVNFVLIFGLDNLLIRMRLKGNLRTISSTRSDAMFDLWEIFLHSPFKGFGFGAADSGLAVQPTNLFYSGMLVEVGIFGASGAVLLMCYPLFIQFLQRIQGQQVIDQNNNQFYIWTTCIIAGFIPYLIFEFNVFRVSAIHQLFSLCLIANIALAKKKLRSAQ